MADIFETEDEKKEYEYILNKLKGEYKSLTIGDIEYILDIVYDYYVKEGFIKEDDVEDAEDEDELVDIYEDEIFEYVTSRVEQDGKTGKFTDQLVDDILACDYEYCEETGIFEDGDDSEA